MAKRMRLPNGFGQISEIKNKKLRYLVGHTIKDLTERVYTERSVDWLKTEIEKIKSECRNGV